MKIDKLTKFVPRWEITAVTVFLALFLGASGYIMFTNEPDDESMGVILEMRGTTTVASVTEYASRIRFQSTLVDQDTSYLYPNRQKVLAYMANPDTTFYWKHTKKNNKYKYSLEPFKAP